MCNSCGIFHKIEVDGKTYNYIIRRIDPVCKELWCQIRRATIEISPKRYKNIYSTKEITEKDIIEVLKKNREG